MISNQDIANGKNEPPVCPKPCKPSPHVPEFLYPLSCKHSHSSHSGSSEILGMISNKKEEGSESIMSTGCPPCCYCGSPPSRTSNPVVQDVQFGRSQRRLAPTKLSDRISSTSTAHI